MRNHQLLTIVPINCFDRRRHHFGEVLFTQNSILEMVVKLVHLWSISNWWERAWKCAVDHVAAVVANNDHAQKKTRIFASHVCVCVSACARVHIHFMNERRKSPDTNERWILFVRIASVQMDYNPARRLFTFPAFRLFVCLFVSHYFNLFVVVFLFDILN